MPRPYRRKVVTLAADGAKARIIGAACDLLLAEGGFGGFTVEAVAAEADVARATIYYQFGSKSGLLEAVLDEVAGRAIAFPFEVVTSHARSPDVIEEMVRAITAFWSAERLLMRRFYGLAALDPDMARAIAKRDDERREGVRAVVDGYLRSRGRWSEAAAQAGARTVYALLRFDVFDTLAGDAPLDSAAPTITDLIVRALS